MKQEEVQEIITCPHCGARSKVTVSSVRTELGRYLGEWKREYDELEMHMADIHTISVTGESVTEPMRTTWNVISYDDILIKGAQLATIPLNHDEPVERWISLPGNLRISCVCPQRN